jgi:hypothetical protein
LPFFVSRQARNGAHAIKVDGMKLLAAPLIV